MSSLHSILTSRRRRLRNLSDERETLEAAEYFRGVKTAVDEMDELGPDPVAEPDAPTTEIAVVPPAPEPSIRQRPRVEAAGPGWTERDVWDRSPRRVIGTIGGMPVVVDPALPENSILFTDAEQPEPDPAPLPERRRRHLPAVGSWFAERMRPVPLPAIPDADRYRAMPMPTPDELAVEDGPAIESGRLALEAAASTHHFPDAHPDDYIAWLRAELADTFAACDRAIAEHAAAAQADLAALDTNFFQDADLQLAELNTMTLPGWTNLETALYNTGVFAS